MSEKPPLNFAEIDAFMAVARTKSFRGAAEDLGMAQSSISDRVAHLESKLGSRLVERTTRHVELTSAGRDLTVYGNALLGLSEQVRCHFEQPPLQGVLKLGLAEDFVTSDLHRILTLFKRQHPRFAITVLTGLSSRLFGSLEDGTLDVVLAKRRLGRSKGRLLFTEPLVWVGAQEALEGCAGYLPIATYPPPSETRDNVLEALRRDRRVWTIVAESASLSAQRAAVEANFAIGALSRRFVPEAIPLLPDHIGMPDLGAIDYVIDQRAEPRDPAVAAFVEILSAAVTSQAVS